MNVLRKFIILVRCHSVNDIMLGGIVLNLKITPYLDVDRDRSALLSRLLFPFSCISYSSIKYPALLYL